MDVLRLQLLNQGGPYDKHHEDGEDAILHMYDTMRQLPKGECIEKTTGNL